MLPSGWKTQQFHHTPAPSGAGSRGWILHADTYIFFSSDGDTAGGKNPNKLFKPIKPLISLYWSLPPFHTDCANLQEMYKCKC